MFLTWVVERSINQVWHILAMNQVWSSAKVRDQPPRPNLFAQALNQLQGAIQDIAKRDVKADSMQPWLHSEGVCVPRQVMDMSTPKMPNKGCCNWNHFYLRLFSIAMVHDTMRALDANTGIAPREISFRGWWILVEYFVIQLSNAVSYFSCVPCGWYTSLLGGMCYVWCTP